MLKDISFGVDSGEVVSIIGPSGSGKSTLLRCATFLETIDGGEILYMDQRAAHTDEETGKAVYKKLDKCGSLTYDWIRASASMPLASKVVELEGMKVLDGGVADSIPLEYFESIGYERNVVILTQPDGYVKEHNKLMPLMRIALRKYPKMIEAMDKRHLMYNKQLVYVYEAEKAGRALVIRPSEKLPIGHISHDPEEMQRVYDIGRQTGEAYIDKIKAFYL